MKKLLIIASVVTVACVANAASFVWGLTSEEIVDKNGDYMNGGTALLFLGKVTATESAFDLSTGTFLAASGQDPDAYTYGNFATEIADMDTSDALTSTAGGQDFSIILIGKNGATAADLTAFEGDYVLYTGKSVQGEIPSATGGDTVFYGAFFDAGSTYAGAWATMAPVPEPTSGLLMLIGMAGLALRRRRA